MQILSSMNLTLACKYLETQVMKHSNKFYSLSIVGYFKVTTKELPGFLSMLMTSTAVSSNRSCKALCRGLHQCILEWCGSNPDDFLQLWLRSDRTELKAVRDISVNLFCSIAGHINKDKRRCAMWPCMGALLRLCSSRIKASLDMFGSMKKGLFSSLTDDECSKFCRRYEKFVSELSLSSFSTPEQKSHFLVSLQVLRDALEAITMLSSHAQSPHMTVVRGTGSARTLFDQELEQLWRVTGSAEVSGVKRPNVHVCCDFLLDPTKPWLSEFSSKSEVAFSIGVLGIEKDIKIRIAKLAYDVMLAACRLKNTPNTPLQSRNPFNIRGIWELLVSQRLKNFYFVLFVVRVIREIIQECASSQFQPQEPSTVLERGVELTFHTSHVDTKQTQQSILYSPGSSVIDAAVCVMGCSLQELSMLLIDVVRQSIIAHHDLAIAAATADSKPKPYADKNIKSVIMYWVKQVLRIIADAPHLGFIPGSSTGIEALGWLPQKAKQVFSEVPRQEGDSHFRGSTNSYKTILSSLETGPAKWVGNKPYCVVFTILMCFESFDLMLLDPDRETKNLSHEAISSIFSGRLMPLYYPEAPIEGVLTVFGVICAAASEQVLALITQRQPHSAAQKGLHLLKHCCRQLLHFLSQSTFESQLEHPNLAVLKPRLSIETLPGEAPAVEWLGHRVEFMIFIAACEVDPALLAELYGFVGVFCDVLSAFHHTDHPHFALFQYLGSADREDTLVEALQSRRGFTHRIHGALRDATFQISRNHFSLSLWSHLFFTWSAYVEQLMATDKQARTIDDARLDSYASFLLLLSPTLWAPGMSKEAKMTQVFNVFLEFFNKMLVEYIDDLGNPKSDRRPDDKFIDVSRQYFKKFLSKSFPSIFCEELFACLVYYYKETLTKDLQRLCRKYGSLQDEGMGAELQAKYCLPLYCDVLLAVLGSLSESLSQKCLKDLKEITLTILCSWANNSSKVHPDDFIQRLQLICQVVSCMTKVRSLLPFSNGYGFWSLWLQQTYDWAVRLSNEQSSSSRVEIFNAINLLLQVVPENKLEEKDARASDKKYLKFIINELEKQTALAKTSPANRSGAFINEDIQGPLMNGLAAVIKKSKFSVGLDPCLKFVRDLRLPILQRLDFGEADHFAISFTKCIFSLKVLQKSLQFSRKDSGISYSEAAALHVKFAHVINLILDPPHFHLVRPHAVPHSNADSFSGTWSSQSGRHFRIRRPLHVRDETGSIPGSGGAYA